MENGTLLIRQDPEEFDCGRPMHRVPDEKLFGNLNLSSSLRRFAGGQALACIIHDDGKGSFQPMSQWVPRYDEERKDFLRLVTAQLNQMLANGGCWVTAWTNDGIFMALWFDGDGDLQFTLEDDRPFVRMRADGVDFILSNCALSQNQWAEHEKELEIKPWQKVKAAQGETLN